MRTAPRLWQRFFTIPLLSAWEALTQITVWLTDTFEAPVKRILPPLPPGEFLVVGHRGAPVREVENTLPAFERALAEGANAIETDLCVTKDGHAVLWHDWEPDGLVAFARQVGAEFDVRCRPAVPPEDDPRHRPICELTLEEFLGAYGYADIGRRKTLPVRIPLLEDLVRWAAEQPSLKVVVLDLKVPPAKKELVHVIRERLEKALATHPCATEFVYMSPHGTIVDELRRARPGAPRTLDTEIPPGFVDAAGISCVGPAIEGQNAYASIGRPRFTFAGWRVYRKVLGSDLRILAGRLPGDPIPGRIICWTINRPREMRRLVRLGVHGILTDVPALLCREMAKVRE